MNFSGPLLTLLLTVGVAFAPTGSTEASTENPDDEKPPLGVLRLVGGDVRYSPNHQLHDPTKPWEEAEEGMDIEQGGVLATREGRAEVDLQNGVKLFLAENSVLVFWHLRAGHHGLQSELELGSGTASIYGPVPDPDSFLFGTASHNFRLKGETSTRIDSYSDGTAITPLGDGGDPDWLRRGPPLNIHNGFFYAYGRTTPDPSLQLPVRADWDQWAAWAAQHPVAKRTQCTSPLEKLLNPDCRPQQYGDRSRCASFEAPLNGGCSCPGGSACPVGFRDPAPPPNLRRHHKHYVWLRAGKTVGYVPKDPHDRKGQPPINLKYGILVPSRFLGKPRERIPFDPSGKVTVLSRPPREFRNGLEPEMSRVAAPPWFARSVEESMPRSLSADANRANGGSGAGRGRGGKCGNLCSIERRRRELIRRRPLVVI